MIPYAKNTVEFAVKHGTYGPDGIWRCTATHCRLKVWKGWRTIGDQTDGICAGLEVKAVRHVFCPECTPDFRFPRHGEPISIKNLIGYQP